MTQAHDTITRDLDLSIVVPLFNEEGNVAALVEEIVREAGKLQQSYEVILVNDGSRDSTGERLDSAAAAHPEVKVIHFAYNCGQTLALAAGMAESRGKVIVTLDGDRQNDPADMGALIKKLDEGYACVSGWRKKRQDSGVKRFPSRLANGLMRRWLGVPVHDLGCTLKAYRAGALDPHELFGEMHRFLVLYVLARGGKVGELVVNHRPRVAGVSKYGLSRAARVVADLLLIRVLVKYRTRPSHLLAKMAQYLVLAGAGLFGLSIALDFVTDSVTWHLGFMSAVVLGTGAAVILAAGVACELIVRNRYALSNRVPWSVSRRVNFDARGNNG